MRFPPIGRYSSRTFGRVLEQDSHADDFPQQTGHSISAWWYRPVDPRHWSGGLEHADSVRCAAAVRRRLPGNGWGAGRARPGQHRQDRGNGVSARPGRSNLQLFDGSRARAAEGSWSCRVFRGRTQPRSHGARVRSRRGTRRRRGGQLRVRTSYRDGHGRCRRGRWVFLPQILREERPHLEGRSGILQIDQAAGAAHRGARPGRGGVFPVRWISSSRRGSGGRLRAHRDEIVLGQSAGTLRAVPV